MVSIYDNPRTLKLVDDLRHRLNEGVSLPVLPEISRELIMLRNRPNVDIPDLVSIVQKDAVLSAQLLRQARMSIYGYGERIKTVDDAIKLVIGFDGALHLALGLSAGKSLRIESGGPLGMKNIWLNSLQTAVLVNALAKELPVSSRPNLGLSYLAGLMHNIGYLLIGSLYTNEFDKLNRVTVALDDINTREREFHYIGLSHDMIGSMLLRNWGLPEEIIVAVAEHHFPDYDGPHAIYAKLVNLANILIAKDEIIFSDKELATLEALTLDEMAVQRSLERLAAMRSGLDEMVYELVA